MDFAELIIGQVIALARRLGEANAEMHSGVWKKYTTGRFEIRGKTLGIVGYGNIGTFVSESVLFSFVYISLGKRNAIVCSR